MLGFPTQVCKYGECYQNSQPFAITGISSTCYGCIQNFRLCTLAVPVSNSDSREASRNLRTPRNSKFELRFFLHCDVSVWQLQHIHWEFQCNFVNFKNILQNSLNSYQAHVFNPQHLEGASSDLVQSMFQVGRKAAELERVKLQTEIQKDKSELRRKKLEKRLKMSGKAGGRSGPAKNPKKTKREPDDDDDLLDDSVTETELDRRQLS